MSEPMTELVEQIELLARPEDIQEQMAAIEIVSGYVLSVDEEFQAASRLLLVVKARMKEIDAERTELVKPLNDEVKAINAQFKPATDRFVGFETKLKRMMSNFVLKKQEEQQRLLRAAAVEAAKQKVTDVGPPAVAMSLRQAAQSSVAPVMAGIGTGEVWKWEPVNLSDVPREFMSVDTRKVDAAVKAGTREISGLRIFKDIRIVARPG